VETFFKGQELFGSHGVCCLHRGGACFSNQPISFLMSLEMMLNMDAFTQSDCDFSAIPLFLVNVYFNSAHFKISSY
jgi:hypothetical protein